MTEPLPTALHDHLAAPSLVGVWDVLTRRLERTGHGIRGSVIVEVDVDGADRLAGLLGRPITAGSFRLALADLDTALRHSSASRGLVAVLGAINGAPLRDLPAQRSADKAQWQLVWQDLEDALVRADLARLDWVPLWVQWLHASGVIARLGVEDASVRLRGAVAALGEMATALVPGEPAVPTPQALGELASRSTGSAHGLDDGHSAAALVLRAASIALDVAAPASSAERRLLWQRLGVEPDLVSGTALVWALRPPGADPWSSMMNERADLGLVTHLTVHELRQVGVALAAPDTVIFACENPQVLQSLADAGTQRPLACLSGNPSTAGLMLAERVRLRYHGDFDWPGVAIARRILQGGAEPWRMGAADYRAAVRQVPAQNRLALTGRSQATPWDVDLADDMRRLGVAVHEESLINTLLADLR